MYTQTELCTPDNLITIINTVQRGYLLDSMPV